MVCRLMKKINNKFRNNNNNNQIYSLNYRFDSISIAGKCSGTALDLIKRYNELAKEAQANSDYVSAETFRQFAEHYRKIVTDINEKKNSQPKVISFQRTNEGEPSVCDGNSLICNDNSDEFDCSDAASDLSFEDAEAEIAALAAAPIEELMPAPVAVEKREFKVIEISAADSKSELINADNTKAKIRRQPRKKEVKDSKEDLAI